MSKVTLGRVRRLNKSCRLPFVTLETVNNFNTDDIYIG